MFFLQDVDTAIIHTKQINASSSLFDGLIIFNMVILDEFYFLGTMRKLSKAISASRSAPPNINILDQ